MRIGHYFAIEERERVKMVGCGMRAGQFTPDAISVRSVFGKVPIFSQDWFGTPHNSLGPALSEPLRRVTGIWNAWTTRSCYGSSTGRYLIMVEIAGGGLCWS
jgi:hypothetical protein